MAMPISDLSLDDIIKKKYVNVTSNKKGPKDRLNPTKKFNKQKPKPNNVKNTNSIKSRKPNQVKQTGQKKPPPIRDARLKIIQKNRQKLKDARDKLAEIAKQGDARSKLDKLRGKNQNQRQAMTVTQISKGITLKKGRNGQISLSTNKKQNNSLNQRRISNLGHTRFPNPQGLITANLVRRTVNNTLANPNPPSRIHFAPSPNNTFSWNSNIAPVTSQMDHDDFYAQRAIFQQSTKGIKTTGYIGPHGRLPLRVTPTSQNQQYKQLNRPQRIFPNSTMASDWDQHQQQQQVQKRLRDNSSILTVNSPWGRMSSGLKARLDTAPVQMRTMGILGAQSNQLPSSMASAPPQEPIEFRIIVSNLHDSVTHDDIKELFEDIGPLVSSRMMVRSGVAEVVYRNYKDAVKAVDVYHNRQLDGQPMKCMLIKQSSQQQSPLNSGSISRNSRIPPGMKMPSKSIQIVPDIDTIHKALFK